MVVRISANVRRTVADIREKSPLITELEDEGRLRVVGAIYDVQTGKVRFL